MTPDAKALHAAAELAAARWGEGYSIEDALTEASPTGRGDELLGTVIDYNAHRLTDAWEQQPGRTRQEVAAMLHEAARYANTLLTDEELAGRDRVEALTGPPEGPPGATRYGCPLPGCPWSHDLPAGALPDADTESTVRAHFSTHDVMDYLTALVEAQQRIDRLEALLGPAAR